jgi:5-methylcytosine-specific restriction endonuclease McrA
MTPKKNYPSNWKKVSRTIRRIAGNRCEWCQYCLGECYSDGQPVVRLSVHHQGAAYANGTPGDPHDKHDLRRENLVALCDRCHFQADLPLLIEHKRKERLRQRGRLALVVSGVSQKP